ncbi:hypothetical protein D3C79_839020 [compost metagenome]
MLHVSVHGALTDGRPLISRCNLLGDTTEDRLIIHIPGQITGSIHIGQISCQNTRPIRPHIEGIGVHAKSAVK